MQDREQLVEIERPDAANLSFHGHMVAEARSAAEGVIRIFRTRGGRYVLEQRKPALRSLPIHRVETFNTGAELGRALPQGPGGRSISRQLNLADADWID